jgi:hypothetical protein
VGTGAGSTIIEGSLLAGRDSHHSFDTGLTRSALGVDDSCIPTKGCTWTPYRVAYSRNPVNLWHLSDLPDDYLVQASSPVVRHPAANLLHHRYWGSNQYESELFGLRCDCCAAVRRQTGRRQIHQIATLWKKICSVAVRLILPQPPKMSLDRRLVSAAACGRRCVLLPIASAACSALKYLDHHDGYVVEPTSGVRSVDESCC